MSDAQVAKVDPYADHLFIIAKAAELGSGEIRYANVGIFLTERPVITICRMETVFGHRLRESIHRITQRDVKGPDFVVHEVFDLIVDNYFPGVQLIADEILLKGKRLLSGPLGSTDIARIFQLRRGGSLSVCHHPDDGGMQQIGDSRCSSYFP